MFPRAALQLLNSTFVTVFRFDWSGGLLIIVILTGFIVAFAFEPGSLTERPICRAVRIEATLLARTGCVAAKGLGAPAIGIIQASDAFGGVGMTLAEADGGAVAIIPALDTHTSVSVA